MTLDPRSGVFKGKTDQTQYAQGASTSLCGTLLKGLTKGWPFIRHKITGKTLVKIFGEPTKNQQDYYQLSAALKTAKEADVVRYVADDARYPIIQILAHFALLVIADITWKAKAPGAGSNAFSIDYIVSGNNTSLSIVVNVNAITVNLATDAGGLSTSTADDIKAIADSTPSISALIGGTITGTGSNVQAASVAANFAGGSVPTIETSANPYAGSPEAVAIGGEYALMLFISDGSTGENKAITIENRNATKEQFDLVLWQKNVDASYTETNRYTVSTNATGANSKNGDGGTIYIESLLLSKGSIISARVKDGLLFDEIPGIATKEDFVGGSGGATPTETNLLSGAAVLNISPATLVFLGGISSQTAIDSIAADCLAKGAQCFVDVPFANGVAAAVTWASGLAANENLDVYYNALRADDYLLQGRTIVGHAGHAAAACAYGDYNSKLKTGRAPAGEEFGAIYQWKNIDFYHDLSDTDLNTLTTARINVAVPNTNPNFGLAMFNDQWNRYGIISDYEKIHVQRTIDYVNQSFANNLSSAVHDDPATTKEKVNRVIRFVLEPMVTPAGTLVESKAGDPPFEVIQGESATEPGVYEVTPRISIVKSMRQISLNTHSI